MTSHGGNEGDHRKVLVYANETPFTEPVEPIEIDAFVQQNWPGISKDPVGFLFEQALELPDVQSLPQTIGRATASIPQDIASSSQSNDPSSAYLKDCVASYLKTFWTLQGRFSNLRVSSLLKRTDRISVSSNLPVCEFESQVFDSVDLNRIRNGSVLATNNMERSSDELSSELRTQLTEANLDELDARIEHQRLARFLPRFIELARLVEPTGAQIQSVILDYERMQCSSPVASEFRAVKLLLRFSELRLATFEPDFEPMFVSFAIYDLRERRKVTESFYFDFLTDAQRRAITSANPHAGRIDHSTTARACLVPLSNVHTDLFVVIRLEKVLQQGEPAELLETYERRGADETALERYRDAVADATGRTGARFRMPLCWTAFDLVGSLLGSATSTFDDANEPLVSTQPDGSAQGATGLSSNFALSQGAELDAALRSIRPVTIRLTKFFKQDAESIRDEALFRTLNDLKKPAGARRQLKSIAANLRIDASAVDELESDAHPRQSFPPNQQPTYAPTGNPNANWNGQNNNNIPGGPNPNWNAGNVPGPRVPPKPAYFYLSPELNRLSTQFFDDLTRVRPIKMLADLTSRPLEPFTAYRNLLYVYPESVNFNSLKQGALPSNARNISVRVQLMQCGPDASVNAQNVGELAAAGMRPLRAVFGRSSSSELVEEMNTAVQWHNKLPEFYDEIKLRLPPALNASHVLLFTFVHVSCQRRKTGAAPSPRGTNSEWSYASSFEHLIGYTWLPLITNGRLTNGQFALPICGELPGAQHLRLMPDTHLTGLRWLDAHRPLFTVSLSPISSLYTVDDCIAGFFRRYDEAQLGRRDVVMREDLFESEFKRAIDGILQASDEQLVRFLTLILDRLLRVLLVRPPATPGQRSDATANISQTAFETIAKVVYKVKRLTDSRNDRFGRNELLVQYVTYLCTLPYSDLGLLSALSDASAVRRSASSGGRLVHEQLVLLWLVSGAPLRSLVVQNGWFFLELTIRSMHEYLVHTGALRQPRTVRFAVQFLDDLTALIALLARHIADSLAELSDSGSGNDAAANEHAYVTMRNLNHAIACFLVDLLAVLEWRFVFELARHYFRVLTDKQSVLRNELQQQPQQSVALFAALKVDFLRAFINCEHFLAFNVPLFDHVLVHTQSLLQADGVPPPPTTVSTSMQGLLEFTDAYRQQHFVLGLFFAEIMLGLHAAASSASGSSLQRINEMLIEMLFSLIGAHELDQRLSQPGCLSRVVLLYAPLLRVVTDRLHLLYDPHAARRSASQFASTTMRRKRSKSQSQEAAGGEGAFANFIAAGNANPSKQLSERATKQLLICLLFVLRHADRDLLRCWWAELSQQRLLKILDCLTICANNFELPEKYAIQAKTAAQAQMQTLARDQASDNTIDDRAPPPIPNRPRRSSAAYQSARILRPNAMQKNEATDNTADLKSAAGGGSADTLVHETPSSSIAATAANQKSATMQRSDNKRGSMRRYNSSTSVNALTLVEIDEPAASSAAKPVPHASRPVTQRSTSVVSNTSNAIQSAQSSAGDLLVTPGVVLANTNSKIGGGSGTGNGGVTAIVQQQQLATGNVSAYAASPFSTLPRGFGANFRSANPDDQQPRSGAKLSLSQVFNNFNLSASSNNAGPPGNTYQSTTETRREDVPDNSSVSYAAGGGGYAANPSLILDGNLSTQVILNVIDVLELITQIVNCNLDSMASFRLPLMRVYLHLLGLSLSNVAQENVLASLQSFVRRYPDVVFDIDCASVRAELCYKLLRLAASRRPTVRQCAVCTLCVLLRLSFDATHAHFARFKSQLTIALSGFVPEMQSEGRFEQLRAGLRKLLDFADFLSASNGVVLSAQVGQVRRDKAVFNAQMRALVASLEAIATDSCRLNILANNNAMLVDTMYRIACSYRVAAPELRIGWLQSIARKHLESNQNAEAAQCYVHAAAIVSEYLMLRCSEPHLPRGAVAFDNITPNVLEECAVSDDTVMPAELDDNAGPELTELTDWKLFTEQSLAEFIDKAVNLFMQAGLYEMVGPLAQHLIPILEHRRSYRQLSALHARLHDAYQKAHQLAERRIYATFFRIAFFGSRLGELDGCEFVQKEPALTKLAEISHRLEAETNAIIEQQTDWQASTDSNSTQSCASESVRQQGTAVRVEVIKDSNNVDRSKLDLTNRVYVQVTYVEPYFEQYELLERRTAFERNYNVRRFVYATPFTTTGKPHGELGDQFKRKTILTVGQTFPFVTVRQSVIAREQIVLTPIEVACEDIEKKIAELGNALRTEPIDTKMLQMVLQGCIGTAVNQGPVELASVFLNEVATGRVEPTRFHCKLRILFKRFLKRSQDALVRNRDLITPEQKEYQLELERTYIKVKERIESLIGWAQPAPQTELLLSEPPGRPPVQSTYNNLPADNVSASISAPTYGQNQRGQTYCNLPTYSNQPPYGNLAAASRGGLPKTNTQPVPAQADSVYANQSQRSSVTDVYVNDNAADTFSSNATLRKSVTKRTK